MDWSRDGRYIIEQVVSDSKSGGDIWVLPLSPEQAGSARKPYAYLQTNANESSPRLSPDGLWLAYQSDETKQNEIYVQRFPQLGGTSQVSANGGTSPVWSRDGKQLYFIRADGKMMAVDVKTDPKFEHGIPKSLFDVPTIETGRAFGALYDVGKDGRFLIPVPVDPAGQAETTPITVVVNWTALLK